MKTSQQIAAIKTKTKKMKSDLNLLVKDLIENYSDCMDSMIIEKCKEC